jgi:hypothetical protein
MEGKTGELLGRGLDSVGDRALGWDFGEATRKQPRVRNSRNLWQSSFWIGGIPMGKRSYGAFESLR